MQDNTVNRRSVLVGLSVVPVLAACGSGDEPAADPLPSNTATNLEDLYKELHPAAQEEGSVIWYTSALQNAADAFKEVFETRFPGVEVQILRGNVTETLTRLSQELAAGATSADLLGLSSPGQAAQFEESEFVVPYQVFDYDSYPESSHGHAPLFELFDKFTPMGTVYNTSRLESAEVPTSREELAALPADRFRGKIIMNDLRSWPQVLHYVCWKNSNGREWVSDLGKLEPVLASFGDQTTDGVASGQFFLSPTFNMQGYINLKASGAPIDIAVPSEGIWLQPGSHFIVRNASHPNAAKLFMEFIYSKEGQEAWTTPGYMPGREDVALPAALAWVEDAEIVPIDFGQAFAEQEQLIKDVADDLGVPRA